MQHRSTKKDKRYEKAKYVEDTVRRSNLHEMGNPENKSEAETRHKKMFEKYSELTKN